MEEGSLDMTPRYIILLLFLHAVAKFVAIPSTHTVWVCTDRWSALFPQLISTPGHPIICVWRICKCMYTHTRNSLVMVKEGYVLLITIVVMLRKYVVTPIFRCETQCSTHKLIYAMLILLWRICIQSKEVSASSIILSKGKCPLSDSLLYLHWGFSNEVFHGNMFYYYYSSSICVSMYLCMCTHTY